MQTPVLRIPKRPHGNALTDMPSHPTITVEVKMIESEDVRLSFSGKPMPPDGIEGCVACGEPFKAGDMVLPEVNGGEAHAACCGSEREGYVSTWTGEPIGPDEPIPTGYPWEPSNI